MSMKKAIRWGIASFTKHYKDLLLVRSADLGFERPETDAEVSGFLAAAKCFRQLFQVDLVFRSGEVTEQIVAIGQGGIRFFFFCFAGWFFTSDNFHEGNCYNQHRAGDNYEAEEDKIVGDWTIFCRYTVDDRKDEW